MNQRLFCLVALSAALAGCGYVGDPLPPELGMPQQIQDLRGVQRGDKIVLAFTPSLKATDQVLLKSLSEIDLRGGINPEGGFDINRWADGAKRLPVSGAKAEPTEVSFPAGDWAGKEVIFAVRAIGPRGRPSQWSNLLVLNVVPAPAAPQVTLRDTARGAYLQWTGEGSAWRVWRQAEGDQAPALLGMAEERSWMDENVEYGKSYVYLVQQVVKSGEQMAESDFSAPATVKHEDTFAPAVPTGLTAIGGVKTVELNWDRNTEADFKAYVVSRAEGDGELKPIDAAVPNPSFRDTNVETGKKYRYAVAAVDEKGNRSEFCAPVEITAP
jgi:hypothetical protein